MLKLYALLIRRAENLRQQAEAFMPTMNKMAMPPVCCGSKTYSKA